MTGAVEACQRAVELAPRVPEAHYHLAETLVVAGQASAAVGHVKQAMQLPGARVLHDAALVILGQFDLAAVPGAANPAQYLAILGNRLCELGHPAAALECFRGKLARDPWDTIAAHFVAALSGANPDRPTDEYVTQLFDNCADTFDQQLVEGLSYSVPRELVAAVVATDAVAPPPWDVLDLGCGTGLVGAEIAQQAKRLVGVDLSPKMIQRARERGIYTELICGELMAALTSARLYDVVIAGDVFVYVGKLDAVVPAARQCLRPGGVLAFSVESAEDIPAAAGAKDYWLGPTGRYAHQADYIRNLASGSGFTLKQMQKVRLRLENRQPMMGWLVILLAAAQ